MGKNCLNRAPSYGLNLLLGSKECLWQAFQILPHTVQYIFHMTREPKITIKNT